MAGGSHRARDYDLILGQLVCDRIGLPPRDVARDGFTYDVGTSTVVVKATVVRFMSVEDLAELQAIAHERAIGGPVG